MKNPNKIECPYCGKFVTPLYVSEKGETFCSICGVYLEYISPLKPNQFDVHTTERVHKGIRIAAVQLGIIFGYHIFQSKDAPALYEKWRKERAISRGKTIISIIRYLYKNEKPDVICFPELTVPPTILDKLKRLARKYKIIIIAGSHYTKDRKNCSPVLSPNSETIQFSEKIYPSPWEDAPNEQDRMKHGKNFLCIRFHMGKKGIVMICKDFLHFEKIVDEDERHNIAFVICPMCSPNIEDFYERARILAKTGIYVILCNTVGGIKGTAITFPGGSAFFGSVHERYLNKEQKKDKEKRLDYLNKEEGIIVATFDLEHTFASTIPTDRSRTIYCNYRDPKIIPLIREPIRKPLRIKKINVNTLADLKHYLKEKKIKWNKSLRNIIVKWAEKNLNSPSLAKKLKKCNNLNELQKAIKETISVEQE